MARAASPPAPVRWRRACGADAAGAVAVGRALDVAPHHAPGVAGALHLLQVHRILLGGPFRGGRGPGLAALRLRVFAGLGRLGRGRSGGRTLRFRRWRWRAFGSFRCGARLVNHAEHLADLDVFAVLAVDPAQHAALRRRHLEVDLVRFQLHQRIAGRDDVPFLAEPLGDSRVNDGFADLWHNDVYGHESSGASLPFAAGELRVAPALGGHRALRRSRWP